MYLQEACCVATFNAQKKMKGLQPHSVHGNRVKNRTCCMTKAMTALKLYHYRITNLCNINPIRQEREGDSAGVGPHIAQRGLKLLHLILFS